MMVSKYICLTEFARNKFIQGGFPADKIVVKPNFINPDPGVENHCDGYALYVGRLSNEKGINTLIKSWKVLNEEIPLKIVGDGPLADFVAENVQFLRGVSLQGRTSAEEVSKLMGKALFLIVPSEWYETFGRVVIEAFAKGTPVIVSNIGALAEIVEDGVTGIHFETGNAKDLAAKVKWAANHPEEIHQMGQNGRRNYEEKYTVEKNYQMLMDIYKEAILLHPGKTVRAAQ
jgi:glycosyltransferase involved in cell wall biosynthesis